MRSLVLSVLCVPVVVWGTSLLAEDGVPDPKELFQQLDANGDGQLVADELPKEQARVFERLLRVADKDQDGKLTQDEFLAGHKSDGGPGLPLNNLRGQPGKGGENPKQRFEMLDRNKDGKVTKDEVPEFARERLQPIFDKLGKDEITLDDLRKAERLLAGGGKQNPEKMFTQLDTNGDGKLTADDKPKDGARKLLQQLLKRAGKKEDAEITKEEFLATAAKRAKEELPSLGRPEIEPPRGPHFVRLLDADRDGRISQAEWAKSGELFAELDKNQDGQLDLFELLGPPPEGRDQFGDGPRRPEAMARPAPGKPEGGRPLFTRLDRNSDGKISPDEVPPRLKDRFEQLDADQDGSLSPEELRNAVPEKRPESPDAKPRPKRPEAE